MPVILTIFTYLLILGMVAGFFMHRSDYCLAGAFRDLFLFRSVHRLYSLVFLVAVSAFLFELFNRLGWLPAYPLPWFSQPSLSNLLGGFIFGVGMVLAGGCVVGVLYKFGGGSLLAGVAIVGLFVGSGIYAEFHSGWVAFAQATRLHDTAVTLPQLTGTGTLPWALLLVVTGFFSWLWWKKEGGRPGTRAEGYIPLWITAIALSLVSAGSVLVVGVPLGVTTSYAKIAAWFEQLFVPGHVEKLSFFTMQPASLPLPGVSGVMTGGAGPQWDVVALVQYPLIIGIVAGAMISAMLLGELRFFRRLSRQQVFVVFLGGVVMALGSRMSPGCNIWHILGGLPMLSLQSLLFVAGLFPGAWVGGMVLERIIVRGG